MQHLLKDVGFACVYTTKASKKKNQLKMKSVVESHGIAKIRRTRFISDSRFMSSVVVQ